MKKTRVFVGFLAFLVGGLLFGLLTKAPSARIEIAEETVDLGKVGIGRLYAGTFTIENKGRGPLQLELQKVSCSCTVAEMCNRPIAPKMEDTITAYISVSDSEGPFGSNFVLRTNDPRRPQVVLSIRGIAEAVMKTTPKSLLFGDVAADQLPQTRKFVVRPGRLAPPGMLAHLDARCEDECFHTEIRRNGEGADVLVTLSKEAPLGAVRSSIVLSVNELDHYEMSIPVVGCVTGERQIRPTCLYYGRVAPGVTATRECRIMPLAADETLELVDQGRPPGGSLDVDIARRDGEAVVKTVLHGGPTAGTYEEVLTLRVTAKDGESPRHLRIPIIYVVADAKGKVVSRE